MQKQWLRMNLNYLLWGVLLFLFIAFMTNQYCRMVYGGGVLYVLSGGKEITGEEKEYLEQKESLIYGETLDSFPAQIYDPLLRGENGFAIDLMEQLSLEMETGITFRPLIWADVFTSLDNQQVDIIQITYSEERNEKYYLTAPIYKSRGVVFLRNEKSEVKQLERLEGKKIAGIKEDYALSVLKEKVPGLAIIECDSIADCAQVVKKGEADGIVADEQNIMYYAQSEKLFQNYYVVEEEVYHEDVVFAVRKADGKLGEILSKAVYNLRTKDTLGKLQQKWFLGSVLDDAVPRRKIYIWIAELVLGVLAFFVYLFWYIHHGTRRIVAERTSELVHERRRLETVLNSIPQYLFEVTVNGDIRLVNRQVRGEIPFCDEEKRKIENKKLLEILREAQGCQYLQREVSIGNEWFRVTCSTISDESSNRNMIVLIEDITLYRLQERQDMQNYKMAAIGHLASGVSHELKNPLEIICNYCYALEKGILNTEEEVLHTVGIIEAQAKNANEIVESLLSFARTVPEEVRKTEIKSCIQLLLDVQKPLLMKRRIEVQFTCEDNIYVKCNPEGIKRIVINLLTNAQDAMAPDGGKIQITVVREVEQVRIEFQDYGKGMSEQELEQIFNPFYTTKSSGTGLGLYLVYHQIEESDGSIQVHSQEGEGTLFRIYLPIECEMDWENAEDQ